ncbi:hypothetical protein NA57DRAFT_71153 [Rhizodiscina lignyota]|uniref:Tat pathway signal sequence n=1 Tax=Rhizodiscina lignyota TaxID=1504668 RepID=A0A9P4IPM5_9PEZI|nr:hypothetical protein NA57DRAFT_71153 [Rhizodiscina lignyota]
MLSTLDITPAAHAIQVEQIQFKGSPAWLRNGSAWVPDPGPIDYVGHPTPELDEAWEKLLRDRYFMITEEEARAAFPTEWKEAYAKMPGGEEGYLVGLDMFHTLHCVNQIRQMLWPEYYEPPPATANFEVLHKGHCIDQIRQYIMCSGDLTPIPTKFYDFLGGFRYVDSNYPHTCRNFGKIREWVDERVKQNAKGRGEKSGGKLPEIVF